MEGSAKEESLAGYDTTGLYNSEFLPQAEALEANAKGSLREGRNKLGYLAQATKPEMFQLNNNKCVQGYGYHANLRMHKSLGEALRTDHEADPIDVSIRFLPHRKNIRRGRLSLRANITTYLFSLRGNTLLHFAE